MEKILKLYTYVDGGVNDTPFPNTETPIEIGQFRYDAKRMGGAPTITTSVGYPSCLDGVWSDAVYALFNGEKYYLKQTPTSSYNNESAMYRHDLELVSERVILDDVYFFDTVVDDPMDSDKPVSNSTTVTFFGDVREFVARLNASLEYAKLLKWEDGVDDEGNAIKIPNGYHVVVDDGIVTEEKLVSFEDQFFSNVLQEIYNTYEVPYYFEGKTIHIGKSMPLGEDEEIPTFSYGVDDALLSITKNNANYKIVNRVTGTGSSENIPFYYPNNSPKGEIAVDTTSTGATFAIVDGEAFSNEVGIGDVVVYGSGFARGLSLMFSDDGNKWTSYNGEALPITITNMKPVQKWFLYTFQVDAEGRVKIGGTVTIDSGDTRDFLEFLTFAEINNRHGMQRVSIEDGYIDCGRLDAGSHTLKIGYSFPYLGRVNYTIATTLGTDMASGWYNETQEKETSLAKMGLAYSGTLASGDTITQRLVKYVKTSQNLMPSVYRETDGAERFYNATNGLYPFEPEEGYELKSNEYILDGLVHNDNYKNEDGEYIEFNNPYTEGRPKEHIITVEDIKPTIEKTEVNGLRIDMFSEFAYDEDDNDETYEDEDGNVYFKHPYFYGKLRVMDFNLFDHAIENQPMTISFTSGDCGACNFEIGVTEEYPQKNPVQVDDNGNLVRGANGMVLAGVEGTQQDVTTFQDRQQDTSKYEVWIALRKEEETYGILMPQVAHRPKAAKNEDGTPNNEGDTFAILGINLPESYIKNAEKKLEAEIIKYLKENNDEKFTFSINFSRIYFAENNILDQLSENSKIAVMYDGHRYDLYVSSFSYNMAEGDVLPEIRVELDDTLKVSQNALQNAISQVKSELGRALGSIDVVGAATPYFIRKDADDEARGRINFTKGIKFGEGGKVEVMDNNSAKLTIEYLEVTKKASFTSLEIQEKTHVGGQILVTPAAINCGEVEELEDAYRCYFQTKGADGDEIFNQFAVGDQAICQTFNAWGSKYYWRLVVGIGEDYIDLSKTDCDEDSDVPSAGDKIIQMGNREDEERQNAIVIAAYGDGSPYIIQYKGINAFEIPDSKIVTKLSSTENIFTGKVHMEMGSGGLENLPEWTQVRDTANEALEKVDAIGESSFEELRGYVDAIAADLQGQIDGAIDSFFYEYEPTTSNYPANEWNTAEEKSSHLNDTFTNLTDGRSWRWSLSSGMYSWVEITDTATSQALALAGQAQETADGKMAVFISQPKPPYNAGDLWAGGEDTPLRRCIVTRESGSYVDSDWALADNAQAYADAIKAELEQNVVNTAFELQASIDKAKEESKDYTDEAKGVINQRISEVERAKANLEDVYDKATADGKISDAEEKAILSANAYANAQSDYLDRTLRAWADGEIDDAEARAIAEAESKVNAAKEEMEHYTDEMVNGMEIGGENLLRNSGFTGDYLSEQLADESVLESASELFSAPFDHWEVSSANVQDSEESVSGKESSIVGGSMTQRLAYKIVPNESYVVSFKAKGTSLRVVIGTFDATFALSEDWTQYEESFTTTTAPTHFTISNATCLICDLKLEKGNKKTSWSPSQLDNASDRAYYQSLKYLSSAIVDGSTDILGGLVLTNQIKVGNYANQEMIEETGGMNGSYTDAESPFLWGGGTLQEAIATIAKHEGGTATPAGEIPFAVTHGGKVILNDAMVRGTVHIGEGSSGLEDFQEWSGKQSQIDSASSNASNAQSVANEAKTVAANAQTAASDAQTKANEAQTAASNAQTAANNAKGVADAAAQRLTTWATDGVISPVEKPALKNELAQINADYNDIIKQLEVYEIENESTERATYVTRFTSYRDALNSLINAAEGATIPSSFATAQSDYYTARTSILDAIAKAAKKVADDAQATADEAKKKADNAAAIANSYQYIATALTNGSTYIDNGLILTSLVLLGTMSGSSFANKAGVNGVYSTDNSPAFWAGGTLDQATTTITKYLQDPTFQPTDAELATMAKAVITHGGRAILNDVILRGTVYATNGEFSGIIRANGGEIGSLQILVNPYTGETTVYSSDECHYGRKNTTSFSDELFLAESTWNDKEGMCRVGYAATMSGMGFRSQRTFKNEPLEQDEVESADIVIEHAQSQFDGTETAIKINSGVFEGLRPSVRTTTASTTPLDEFDHTVIIKNSTAATIKLPSDPRQGQTYRLLHTTTSSVTIDWNGKAAINIATGTSPNNPFSARRSVILTYCDNMWYAEYTQLAE